jgi:hypothetical protein
MEAIRYMHADFYDLHDHTCYNASANSSNKIKILEEVVTIDDSEQSLQTISSILSLEGTETQCINQKAHLMSEQNQLSQNWVAELEGGPSFAGQNQYFPLFRLFVFRLFCLGFMV